MTISIIVPVYHEEALINDAINRLLCAETEEAVEIIVVDGGEEAATLKAMTVKGVKGLASRKGRGTQMNKGAAAASGNILLFLHIDTKLPSGGLRRISSVMKNDNYAGGAFDLEIADRGYALRIIEKAASIRSRITRIPYGDQAIFLRRDYFLRMGGYRDLPVMEDMDLMRRIKRNGGKICLLDERVKTSSRRWRREGIIACTLRNWTMVLLHLLGVRPERLARWYP